MSYGLTEYLRIQDMLRQHGWSSRRCIPHGGHQFSLHIAAALKLGGNESYPGEFQPTGGFADNAVVLDSQVGLTDIPGIGFEGKAAFYKVLRAAPLTDRSPVPLAFTAGRRARHRCPAARPPPSTHTELGLTRICTAPKEHQCHEHLTHHHTQSQNADPASIP